MPSQSIVWTTVPHGRITLNGKPALRVSVFVSPRLVPDADETLKPFAHFLDWPKVAANLRLKLVFGNGGGGELVPLPDTDPLDPALWARLFDKTTFVRGHKFTDLKDEVIRSFPAVEVYGYLHDLYGATGADHGGDFPPRIDPSGQSPLTRLKRDLGALSSPEVRAQYNKRLDVLLKETKVMTGSIPGMSDPEAAFFAAGRFYERPKPAGDNEYLPQPKPELAKPRPVKPEFDFHQCLAALADYPRLMRRLGLVLDYAWVETAAMPAQNRVRVDVAWGDSHQPPAWHQPDVPPWTAYLLDATRFRARAVGGVNAEFSSGYLDLRQAADINPTEVKKHPYLVAQLDLDGSALKALNTAGTLVRMDDKTVTNYRTPDRTGLPALRTSGLSLYRNGRAVKARTQLVRAAQANAIYAAAGRPEFSADDLVRGYRIDVWDDGSGRWHTLCLREGHYEFTKKGALGIELRDEGYVKSSSVSRNEPGAPRDLYLHERLAQFDGWSLVASRPGKTLAADPTAPDPVVPSEDAATQFGLATRFKVPAGSLPRLRYGRNYRLRVRVVDVAGNSIELDAAEDGWGSQPFLYSRFEPVPSPTLLLRARVTEGESLEHLVIRSDYDQTASAYAAAPHVLEALEGVRDRLGLQGAARAGYAYAPENERHLAPPKISQLEAETHGRFDEFIGPGKDHAKGYRLALRESASFLSQRIVNLNTGAEEPIPGLDLEVVPATGGTPTDLDDPARKPGDPLQQGEYVLHKESDLIVPYLPDPLAAGVAFVGLPGWVPALPFVVLFEGDWPNPRPLRIRLVERMGTLSQCTQAFADDGQPKWDPATRVLTVFQPKAVSTTVRYSSLLPGEADAKAMGMWKFLQQRGALTAANRQLILSGRHWMFTPWRTFVLVNAVQRPLCPPNIETWSVSRLMGDTFASLRGRWHLSVKSTSQVDVLAAWSEPIDDPTEPTWQILQRSAHVAEVAMELSYSDELDIPVVAFTARSRRALRHEFGDTKHRRVRYRLKGTTRFREYFPIEITRAEAAITRVGDEREIIVPSSARPAAARPVYVLPTFRWEETPLPNNGVIRVRRGNGLRIYLERPWWSSGDSERLGVVFKTGVIGNEHKPYVSQWGKDPAFDSTNPAAGPTMVAFPLAVDTRSNVSLEEIGDTADIFAVAGHAVEFDPERKLWFADVVLHAGVSYFPFVRLALARFQPWSIADCHLSRVVLTDFIQLVPDRTLDVRWIGPNKVRVKIYGPAPTETWTSRVFSSAAALRSATATFTPPAAVRDIVRQPVSAAQVRQAFQVGNLEVTTAPGVGGVTPGVVVPAPTPAEPSKRPGLNEYSVVVEALNDPAAPDFSWESLSGASVTKPPPPPPSPIPIDPRLTTKVTRKSRAATKVTLTDTVRVSPTTQATDVITNVGEISPGFVLTPLWEADVTFPPANDTKPRRLVVREHEVYFKATPDAGEFIPLARRLVYVDIVNLPSVVA